MEDFPELPLVQPSIALSHISTSPLTRAQKLLAASLVTEARSFEYILPETKESLLVLDVTRFLNHRVNTRLIEAIGEELAKRLEVFDPNVILTAPSSGNIPAISTALHLPSKPDVIYAPKGTPITMNDVLTARSRSYTHGKTVDLTVSKDCLAPNSRVAICDDFLDTGKTGIDLTSIVNQAQAQTVATFFVIEKPFGGREKLKEAGFSDEQIISLITIESMRVGKLKIKGFNEWFELKRQ